MKKSLLILALAPIAVLAGNLGLPLYTLPAVITLPKGIRPGLELLTLPQAAQRLLDTGKTGWDLVEAARALDEDRMQYSRRNSFDRDATAFARGYGFCTQQAYALVDLLTQLGFEAKAVHALRNRFPDGNCGGHTWVRVSLDGETRFIDSIFYDAGLRQITFRPDSKIYHHTLSFKALTRSGEAALNAHRYYCTGRDSSS
jgi:hypothetical protein